MNLKHVLSALVLLTAARSQQPIRVDVSVVTVGVRVTDSRGRDVEGLQSSDFSLFEDDQPREIAFFSNETQPIALGILVDSSSSMALNQKIDRARDAATALVRESRDGSEFFYIDFDDRVTLSSNFTTDKARVTAEIAQTVANGGTSLYDALLEGLSMCSRASLPRQVLVIISDGADQHSTHTLDQVRKIVRESGIQIYTIGYFGEDEERMFRTSGIRLSLTNGQPVDNPRIALEQLAKESGGESYFPRSDQELERAVRAINADLRAQYTLAFYPSNPADQAYHPLKVTVDGGRFNVRARPGFGKLEFESVESLPEVSRAFEGRVSVENERTIYHDDFADPGSGWPRTPNANYVEGGYRISGEDIVITNGPTFKDFQASVSFVIDKSLPSPDLLPRVGTRQLPTGVVRPVQTGAGLVFRQSSNGYYGLVIVPSDGLRTGYALAIQTEGLKTTELERWPLQARPSDEQSIVVRCRGEECELHEGGRLLGILQRVDDAEGQVGLLLSAEGTAVFRNLRVEPLP